MYINPYSTIVESEGKWMKTNFHTHAGSNGHDTCGIYDLEEVIQLYKEAGYEVLTISNHDLFTDTGYLKEKYGISLINGFEYSQLEHMLCIGCKKLIIGEHQEAIDECVNQGGFVVLCHPHWNKKDYWPEIKIDKLKKYTGIEILNSVIGRLSGTGIATDTWDYLLSQGRLVWGFGNDDFHRWYDLNKSWNMIYSISNREEDIKSAVKIGAFYVSNGLVLEQFTFTNNTIKIKACEKDCYPLNYEYVFIGKNGEILQKSKDIYGEYKIKGNEPYVRIKVMSEQGYNLWTQPLYNENVFNRI